MGTYTIVKANPAGDHIDQSQDPNSVIISDEKVDSLEEVKPEEIEVITNDTDQVELPEESTQVPEEETGITEESTQVPEEETGITEGSNQVPEEETGVEQKTDTN